MATGAERLPTRAEFVQEAILALREAGLEGPIDYDDTLGTLVHGSGVGLDVHALYESLGKVPKDLRLPTLARLARAVVRQEKLPDRWEDAKDRVLPLLKRGMDLAVENLRHSPREAAAPRARGAITPHLVFEVVVPCEEGASLAVPGEAYAAWGVGHDEIFQTAAKNLKARSQGPWMGSPEAPGVLRSPWKDGFDAARLVTPLVIALALLRRRPVAVAPNPSMLLIADSEDAVGLTSLANLAQRIVSQDPYFFFLRPLRLGEDAWTWEEWLPPAGHPARAGLRLLSALEERRDYDCEIGIRKKYTGKAVDVDAVYPPLVLTRSSLGEPFTMAVWTSGEPRYLPKADTILLRRGDDVLGWAPWDDVARALPQELSRGPGYPARHLVTDFPEDWQMGELELMPWERPPTPS